MKNKIENKLTNENKEEIYNILTFLIQYNYNSDYVTNEGRAFLRGYSDKDFNIEMIKDYND